jgi:large subunit ribosomal protein L18
MAKEARNQQRIRRHQRVRKKVAGTKGRPRLNVFRSLNQIYAQIIDDDKGHTMVSVSSLDGSLGSKMKGKSKTEQASLIGEEVAKRAKKAGVKTVVFDRGGYRYHGRVRALAEAAREGGLEF